MAGEYPISQDDLLRKKPYWLLSAEVVGQTFRWASEPVTVTAGDGTDYVHRGGLHVNLERRMGQLGQKPTAPQVGISGLHMPQEINLPKLAEQGHRLLGGDAELSLWFAGGTWEARVVKFRGQIRSFDYGAQTEPIGFTIRPLERGALQEVPGPGALINAQTYPDPADTARGSYVPEVFGKPGFAITNVRGINGGSHAQVIDETNKFAAIADHEVVATSVTVINATQMQKATLTPATATTTDNHLYTYVDYSSKSTWTADDEMWVQWSGTDGARLNPYGSGTLEGAGDVLRYYLSRTGATVDHRRWATASEQLNVYKLAGEIHEPEDILDFLMGEILPLLPVTLLHGVDGIYPVVWNPDVTASDVVADLDVDLGLERSVQVRTDEDYYNTLRLGYRLRADNGRPRRRRKLTGEDVGASNQWVQPHDLLRASRANLDARARPRFDTAWIYDDTTAGRLLRIWAQWMAFPRRTVAYLNTDRRWGWLDDYVGQPVTITDSEMSWSSRLAWINAVRWNDDTPTIELLLFHHLANATRPTG